MVKTILVFALLAVQSFLVAQYQHPQLSQKKVRFYTSSEWELIFSGADVTRNDASVANVLRFTAFINSGQFGNVDFGRYFGIGFGLGNRNIGMITRTDNTMLKQRTYSLYAPFFLKVGDMRRRIYFYTGAQYEWFYNYKEKLFVDNVKVSKFSEWFSDRTPNFMPSVFAGVQLPLGFNLKFTYMLHNFVNSDFQILQNGTLVRPYEGVKAQVFCLSLSFNIRSNPRRTDFNYSSSPAERQSL